MGLARHLLRRAGAIRTNRIHSRVLNHLGDLTLVSSERCCSLFVSSENEEDRSPNSGCLHFLCLAWRVQVPTLVQEWVLKIVTNDYPSEGKKHLRRMGKGTKVLGLRGEARVAQALKQMDWVRSYKEIWKSVGPWERRAIIAAGAILPSDERRSIAPMLKRKKADDREARQYGIARLGALVFDSSPKLNFTVDLARRDDDVRGSAIDTMWICHVLILRRSHHVDERGPGRVAYEHNEVELRFGIGAERHRFRAAGPQHRSTTRLDHWDDHRTISLIGVPSGTVPVGGELSNPNQVQHRDRDVVGELLQLTEMKAFNRHV